MINTHIPIKRDHCTCLTARAYLMPSKPPCRTSHWSSVSSLRRISTVMATPLFVMCFMATPRVWAHVSLTGATTWAFINEQLFSCSHHLSLVLSKMCFKKICFEENMYNRHCCTYSVQVHVQIMALTSRGQRGLKVLDMMSLVKRKMTNLIRHKVSKSVQSKDAEKPDDQILQPFLMLPIHLRIKNQTSDAEIH